jgi:hypothetical protein
MFPSKSFRKMLFSSYRFIYFEKSKMRSIAYIDVRLDSKCTLEVCVKSEQCACLKRDREREREREIERERKREREKEN